ncbi:MAG: Gfo/Idh/MocA family oxidoreductase [Bacteroidetes bacterium]|nr:Gfo/Idh/MocA family oxidoreductase [Bacteroidota bacterium]MDA1119568.1 Gfo/Idh/MocA family oxidoreductase [Bacteroidota bacterium]
MKLEVCIVGLGRAGRFHLNSVKQLDKFRLKYVVEPNLSMAKEVLGDIDSTVTDDIDKALSDPSLDAVIVSSPTQFHYEHVRKSLEAGKNVFSEKPLGKTLEEIQTCFDLAHSKGLALHLGFQRRCDKNFNDLKESIKHIGQIRTIKTSSRDNPQPSFEYLKTSGNIFHDMLIHDFDMLIYLLGYKIPESVFAFGHAYDNDIASIPDFDTVLVTIKYPDGLICSIDTSRISVYGYDQRIELFGDLGMAIAENQRDSTVNLYTSAGTIQRPINYSFPQRYRESYYKEIEGFANEIDNKILYNVSRKECILGHVIANAAHESATTNTVVDFSKFKPLLIEN